MWQFLKSLHRAVSALLISNSNILLIFQLPYCWLKFDITCTDFMSKFNEW